MALPSKTFEQFTNDTVAAWAAEIGFNPTLQSGDALLGLMQATASQLVFLQALAQIVNAVARVSTCGMVNGVQVTPSADVDSFMAQFGFFREPATAAEGPVVFGKFTPATSQVLIAPGVIVQTVGGAIQYETIADTAQPTWNPGLNAYVLAVGQSSLTASVQATTPGASYNVSANQLAQIATPLPGIDTVNNAAPISNGSNAESDDAFRARFVNFLNSLSKATMGAIASAIAGVGQGIDFNLLENVNISDQQAFGQFLVVVDNGTGSPPASLIAAVFAAVDAVRGFTIQPVVRAVSVVVATVVIAIRVNTAAGYVQATVNAQVANAIAVGIDAVGIGAEPDGFLHVSQVEGFASAVPGVLGVQPGTLINGENADLAILGYQAPRSAASNITVGNY